MDQEFEKLENFLIQDNLDDQDDDKVNDDDNQFTPPNPAPTDDDDVEVTGVAEYITGLVEMGLFELPADYKLEDLDDDKLQELIDFNDEQREARAFQNLMARMPDARIKEIIDYAEKGGKYADIDKFFQLQKQEDAVDVADKKAYVESIYIKKGIPAKQAKTLVENLELDEELDTEFDKLEQERVANIAAQKAAQKAAAAEQATKEKLANDNWSKNFQTELTKLNLPKKKQQEIVSAFNPLALQNGQSIPEWRYKMLTIQENPAHFIQLLDLLTSYDPKAGFKLEDKAAADTETKVSKSLLDKITQHSKGRTLKGQNAGGTQFTPTDPRNQNVKILK